MNNKVIGQRINTLLAINNIKQKELAKELGVADNIVSDFVGGSRTPNINQIIKISQFFNVSADYILGLTDVSSTDAELRSVCEYTGLSEKAIENIQNLMGGLGMVSTDIESDFPTYIYQHDGINILNAILEKFDFNKLISFVGHSACQKQEMNSNKLTSKQQYHSAISYNASRYILNKLFEELMDSVIDELEVEYHGNNSEEE